MKTSFQPYEGTKPYIFVSYAHKDKARVMSLLDALNLAGYRVWYDKGIQAGLSWAESLAEHIIRCAVFMPFISLAFADSMNCYDETSYAWYKQKAIVPVYLDDVKLPPRLDMAFYELQHLRLSDYRDADAFALTLDMESAFAPCKDTPELHSQEAS